MSEPARKKVVEAARAEMEAMEPPHRTYEQWLEWRDGKAEAQELSRREVARRQAAVLQAEKARRAALAEDGHSSEAPAGCSQDTSPGNGTARNATAPAPTALPAPLEKVIRMLKLADDAALRGDIINVLAPDEALDLAEQMDQPELRNALIRQQGQTTACRSRLPEDAEPASELAATSVG